MDASVKCDNFNHSRKRQKFQITRRTFWERLSRTNTSTILFSFSSARLLVRLPVAYAALMGRWHWRYTGRVRAGIYLLPRRARFNDRQPSVGFVFETFETKSGHPEKLLWQNKVAYRSYVRFCTTYCTSVTLHVKHFFELTNQSTSSAERETRQLQRCSTVEELNPYFFGSTSDATLRSNRR